MEAITNYNQFGLTPAQSFNIDLFSSFISWIDRGEKTTHTYITNLRQFAAWMKYAAIRNPIRKDIMNYREWLAAEHDAIMLDQESPAGWKYRTDGNGDILKIICKPNTIAQYLRSVCQFFRWTAANGLYPDIAANIHPPKVRHDTHRKEALTADEVRTIENSIAERAQERQKAAQKARKDTAGRIQRSTEQGKRLYAMYLLTVNAGLRTVELHRANVKDIVTKGGQSWLYIWGKGHTEPDQKKPIAPEVAEAITDYLRIRKDRPTGNSPLFVSTGNRSRGRRIAVTTISTMLKQAMRDAGYNSERLTAHSLRHTTGTAVQELTKDIYTTQKYMRHSNPATTEIYLHNDTEKAEAGIAQELYNLFHGTGRGADQEHKDGNQGELERLTKELTPQQIEQLTKIAAAMSR